MAHETPSHNTPPDLKPGRELRKFADGRVDVGYKTPGTKFGMAELMDHFGLNPVAQDIGAAYIQTLDGEGKRHRFYLDMAHAVSKDQPWLIARLDKFPITDPSHDITIGEQWESPFGMTDSVEAVVLPYIRGTREGMYTEAPSTAVSGTGMGRRLIDEALEQ